MTRLGVALVALAVAACSSGPVHTPRLLSSRGPVVGEQRVVVEFVDRGTNAPLSLEAVTATLRDRHGSPLGEAEGVAAWVVAGERTAHVFRVDLPEPATYQLTFVADGATFAGPVGIEAVARSPVVAVGDPAPRTRTPILTDGAWGEITSDANPEPALYETSVADAVSSGVAVIVFGSPGHCLSLSCTTVLDVAKAVAADLPDIDFVHVETMQLPVGASPQHVDAVSEWGLVVEPAVFVVRDGLVAAYFEAVLTEDELRRALEP